MAQNRDMANLEARLTTLGSQVEHLAQKVPQAGVSSEDDWMTNEWMDQMNDFMEVMKQAKTRLSSFSRLERREKNVETKEESLVREAAQMTKREELLNQMTANIIKRQELLEQNAAEMKKRGELLDHRAAEILKGEAEQRQEVTSLNNELAQISTSTDRHTAAMRSISKDIEAIDTYRTRILDRQLEGISGELANVSKVSTGLEALSMKFQDMQIAASNATESMTGAAEELRKATETGSKAREALQRILVRQNASLLNDNTAKRGLGPSSPENPPTKRRFVRGSSAGAAEVLANVETPGLLVNTIQAFGNPNERRRPSFETPRTTSGGSGLLAPFTGPMTAPRSGVSSPALNSTSATRQDLIVNSSPNTIIPQSQENDLEIKLLMASDHVRDVWRQIEFPADWTTADSAELLDKLNKAKARKGGKDNRYWPQQAMDIGSKLNSPYCLMRDLKKGKMHALKDPEPCESHASDGLMCINVSFSTDNPGEYDSAATDKRWRLEKR